MNTRDMWHKRAMKTNDKLHWNAYRPYRHFRQEVKREIRLAEKEHVRSEILKSNGNTNSIWKILNRYIPRKNVPLTTFENPLLLANKFNEFYANVGKMTASKATREHVRSEILKSNGNTNSIWKILNRYIPRKNVPLTTFENPLLLANKFNEFYANVGKMTASKATNLADEYNLNIHDRNEINPCEFDHGCGQNDTTLFTFQSITTGDVQRIIKRLPSNKAPGCDKVNAKILKDSSPVIAPMITSLMNNSFSSSTFPLLWKKAEIVPILKSGDGEDPANTRPISLLPILSKVCERAAHLQFVNSKPHSTESALLYFTDELLNNMDQKKISVVVLLDMSKAFDSIRHDLMLCKLRKAGVSESACAWFESYLSQREQVVKIQNTLSIPLPVTVG